MSFIYHCRPNLKRIYTKVLYDGSNVPSQNLDINQLKEAASENFWTKSLAKNLWISTNWRIWMNHELDQPIQGADIVCFIKSRRLEWLGHVRRMDDRRMAKKITDCRAVGRRIKGSLERDCWMTWRMTWDANGSVSYTHLKIGLLQTKKYIDL